MSNTIKTSLSRAFDALDAGASVDDAFEILSGNDFVEDDTSEDTTPVVTEKVELVHLADELGYFPAFKTYDVVAVTKITTAADGTTTEVDVTDAWTK